MAASTAGPTWPANSVAACSSRANSGGSDSTAPRMCSGCRRMRSTATSAPPLELTTRQGAEAETLDERGGVVGVGWHRVALAGAAAVAPAVVGDAAVPAREALDLVRPDPGAPAHAVHEQRRGAVPPVLDPELRTVGLDESHG